MLTTDLSLMALNNKITKNINKQKDKCTIYLCFTKFFLFNLSFSIPKKSTQKEVVNAANAESVVANVAAVSPNKKMVPGIMVK